MVDKNPRVYLDIEDNLIPCDKADLIRHSDYFKVMFEGDFLERHKTTVKIQEVEFKAMTIILTLLWDENYVIDNADILSVLQTACMLQFDKIRRLCVERVTEMLSPDNCVDVWFTTEALGLRPLCLKAKSMALMEFALTKDMECMLELNLSQLYVYLSDVKLRCANEMDVFDTCMKWWYHNVSYIEAESDEEDVFTKILLRFLCCIDFKSVPVSDVKEMMGYPDVSNNEEIVKILEAIVQIRGNIKTDACLVDVAGKAQLLAGCRSRADIQFFCIVVDDLRDVCKRTKLSSEVYTESVGGRSKCAKNVLLYDDRKGRFVKLFSVPQEKHANLEGFHLLGYKEFVFFFGGEISLGRGNWNTNFWVYDTIRERWERKSKLPYGRRHFESCIAGNILYIVGGTGSYRVIQDNMFYYNYRDNIWSKQITLPCVSRQIKCCDYNGQLFLLNVNGKCGYLFDLSATNWWQMDICDTNNLVTIYPEKFSLFSYKNRLYVKGLDMTYVALVSFTSAHLKISQGAFRSVRRTCLKRLNLQGESPYENRRELDDEMQEEIAKCIRHLQTLFTLCRMLEEIYTYLILLQILISLVVLCTCLFLVTAIPLGVQLFGNELAYLLAIENQLAVYCFAGNKITAGGEGIPLAVYECDWFAASGSFKRCMLFTMMRMRRPIYLTIGKFSPLTLSTFVTIGRRSYSLLAVLKNRG